MPSITSVGNEFLIQRIADVFELGKIRVLPMQTGYRNRIYPIVLSDGRCLNVVVYKQEKDILKSIENANTISDFLAGKGFPSRRTADNRLVLMQNSMRQKYASLYYYLPGDTIAWEAYQRKHIKLLGKTMSDMHALSVNFEAKNFPDVCEQYLRINDVMRYYFGQTGVSHAIDTKLHLNLRSVIFDNFNRLLSYCWRLTDKQVLHMDFVRSNLLFIDNDELIVSGVLDFEKTAVGSPQFDIARTLAFLLVDCKYKPEAKIRKYFLYSGYKKQGAADIPNFHIKQNGQSINTLECLVSLFLFYDFYKFLRHNPYEALCENEHFLRTRNLLLRRQIIFSRN
jgi:Ser/Thr protein kinase RdoA (MazF antagonist)